MIYFLIDAKLDPVRYSFKELMASSTNCIYVLFFGPSAVGFPLPVVRPTLEEGVDAAVGRFVVLSVSL